MQRSKILLLGQRRSGKTSIQRVLFADADPKETFYFEPTTRIEKHHYDTIIPLEIWDCPGNITPDSLAASLADFAAMIYVIDITDEYPVPISRLLDWVHAAQQQNVDIVLEVFVHKAEAFGEDYKIEHFKHISNRIDDELEDAGLTGHLVNCQMTSIYDSTLHDVFSRTLHKLIDSLPYLEDLLNAFVSNSQASKAFLFDVPSRLYVATDASPVDSGTHTLCCEYLKTLSAFRPLYVSAAGTPARVPLPPTATTTYPPKAPPVFTPSAALSLAQGNTLAFRQLTPSLALLVLLPTTVFDTRRGLLEWNVVFFRQGVQEIVGVETEARASAVEA